MCLRFTDENVITTGALKKNKKKIRVWKVFHRQGTRFFSPLYSTYWVFQSRVSSSRESLELTSDERQYKNVKAGFHSFIDLETANTFLRAELAIGYNAIIIEAIVRTSDLVMVGVDDDKRPCLVSTKLTFTKKCLKELRKSYPSAF